MPFINPYTAISKKGIVFGRQLEIGHWLIRANIEGAQDHGPADKGCVRFFPRTRVGIASARARMPAWEVVPPDSMTRARIRARSSSSNCWGVSLSATTTDGSVSLIESVVLVP